MTKYTVEFDDEAFQDLAGIRDHIAMVGGSAAAAGFVDRVLSHLEGFQDTPKRGYLREDIRPGLRTVGWRRTLTIAFTVDDAGATVRILAILYRGRDTGRVLMQRRER